MLNLNDRNRERQWQHQLLMRCCVMALILYQSPSSDISFVYSFSTVTKTRRRVDPAMTVLRKIYRTETATLSGCFEFKDRRFWRQPKLPVQLSSLRQQVSAHTMSTTTFSIADNDDKPDNNQVYPKTKPLTRSFLDSVQFIVIQFWRNRRERRTRQMQEREELLGGNGKGRGELFRRLNEQRKNLVHLAEYKAAIVVPSFTFLLLGAFVTSLVPHYWAKCLQIVATVGTISGEFVVTRNKMIHAVTSLFFISTLAAMLTGLRGSLFWIAGARANFNIRVKLHRNLLLQEASFFDSNETGYLLSRLNNDVNKIGQVISYHVNVVCRQLAQFLFGSVYMVRISPELSFYAMLGILLVAIISALYGDFNRELAQRVQDTFADATAVAETSLSMSETIRAFDGVNIESEKYQNAQGRALDLEEVQAWGYGFHKFVSDTVQEGSQVFLLTMCWFAGRSMSIPAEKLTSFLFYANFVLESSNEVGDQWAKIQGAVGASRSVFDLIQRTPAVRDPLHGSKSQLFQLRDKGTPPASVPHLIEPDSNAMPEPLLQYKNGSIEPTLVEQEATKSSTTSGTAQESTIHEKECPIIQVSNITITYGSMEVSALDRVSLDVQYGDRVAIVGRSGSGKSSLLRAMLRFYDPQSGSVKLNGVDLRNMTRSEIASTIAIVEQQPSLFPMSLLDNVLYGIPKDAVEPSTGARCYSESIRKTAVNALTAAGLPIAMDNASQHDNDDGNTNLALDTRVGDGGRSLSGGQRQRVAIARTLVRSPKVILLDEPTAALDSESEKKVVLALQNSLKLSGDCMVMVTHRLNVIRPLDVNRVIVLDQGSIVEVGDPEELLLRKPNGWYGRLAYEQGIGIGTSDRAYNLNQCDDVIQTSSTQKNIVNGEVEEELFNI